VEPQFKLTKVFVTLPYWQVIGDDAVIMLWDHDPGFGAFGSFGATASIGNASTPTEVQFHEAGCVDSVYCGGGGAMGPTDHITGSGVTVVGAIEKFPVATNSIF